MTTERVHLAGDDEDDLYSGFDVNNDIQSYEQEAAFQHAVKTSQGRRPPPTGRIPISQARLGTAQRDMASSMGRPITGAVAGDGARPMTAVRGAGYSSNPKNVDTSGSGQGAAPPLESKSEDSPEEKLKLFEKKVIELIEESCLAASRGEPQLVMF
ncbi:IFT88 [Bugula neritina]|uniref:IFT88 n=1 Tax=Bugula neritina TaxID=10212 RepID=A0A7J7K2E2_BUGNE|nr:IFT88 [Bugula neritina]